MAEPYIANIVGQYQQGQAFGTQQRQQREAEQRQGRLSELASLAYGAQNPDERRSLVGQAIATDPTAGFALGGSLARDDENQQMELVKAIRLVGMYPEAQQPEAYRQVVGRLRQRFPGLPIPDEIDDNARKALAAVNAAYGGGESNLSDRYRVVGGALVDLQDPSKPVYVAPIQTDTGLVEGGPQGFREVRLGQQPPPAAPPAQGGVVTNPATGEQGRFSIGADGQPVFITEGVAPNVAQGITANPAGFQQPTAEAPAQFVGGEVGRPILPKGASAEQERLRLARQAAENATAANQRAAEASERARVEAENRAQFGTIPPGFRVNADRTALEPVPGGPKPAGATASEGERKAATLLKRLEGSLAQLDAAVKENPSAASPSVLAETARGVPFIGGAAARGLNSSERQRVESAQLDILDAALTLGTGAAYTKEQLEGYRESYFPQINDSEASIRDKAARLQNVIEAAKIAAGRAAPTAEAPAPAATQPGRTGATRSAINPKTGQRLYLVNGQWVP